MAVCEHQASQSRWLYAKQSNAVKTLTAINSSCWVKFFPCPIHYWTVNFVFVPARHSSSQMTALSIKEQAVTALQWEPCQPSLPGGVPASPPRNPGTHQHLNQYARVNYWGSEGLSRSWWWGSRANGAWSIHSRITQVLCHNIPHTHPPTTSKPQQKAHMPSASIFSNSPTTYYSTGACLAHFLGKYIGNGESRVWGTIKGKFIIRYTSPVLLIDYLESRLLPSVHLRCFPQPVYVRWSLVKNAHRCLLSFPWEIKLHAQSCKNGCLGQTEAQFYQSSTWWNQGVYWGFLRDHGWGIIYRNMSDPQTATSPPRHIPSWMAALNGWWISWKLYYGIPFSINLLLLIDASSSPKFPEAGEASGQHCLDNHQEMSAAPSPLPWTYHNIVLLQLPWLLRHCPKQHQAMSRRKVTVYDALIFFLFYDLCNFLTGTLTQKYLLKPILDWLSIRLCSRCPQRLSVSSWIIKFKLHFVFARLPMAWPHEAHDNIWVLFIKH